MKLRQLLASSVVVLALSVVLVIPATPAFAEDCGNSQGESLLLGCGFNSGTDPTVLRSSTTAAGALYVSDFASGATAIQGYGDLYGVFGHSDTFAGVRGDGLPYGVYGQGNSVGVYGHGPTGVSGEGGTGVYGAGFDYGVSGTASLGTGQGVFGDNTGGGNGVYGHTTSSGASGVYGQNDGGGFGVAGRSNAGTGLFGDTVSGIAVQAHSDSGTAILALTSSGTALSVQGKMTASRSGIAPVHPGQDRINIQLAGVTPQTFALATVQGSPSGVTGVWVMSVQVRTNKKNPGLTIYFNTAPVGEITVAWFVLN